MSAQSAALILETPEQLNAMAQERSQDARDAFAPLIGDPINVAHWRANDPFTLARKNKAALKNTAIYFNCGQSDDYGFEKGAATLDKQLTSEGIAHEYRPYPGGHSMTYFLSHLGEVIEFHSKTFAGAVGHPAKIVGRRIMPAFARASRLAPRQEPRWFQKIHPAHRNSALYFPQPLQLTMSNGTSALRTGPRRLWCRLCDPAGRRPIARDGGARSRPRCCGWRIVAVSTPTGAAVTAPAC